MLSSSSSIEHELFWFGHGCSGNRMLLEHERYYGAWAWMLSSSSAIEHERFFGLGMDALVTVCSWNTNVIMGLGHGCSHHRLHSNTNVMMGLGMDALVTVCSWNTNVIMGLGHGCSHHRMHSNTNVIMGLGMDALIIECTRTRTLL